MSNISGRIFLQNGMSIPDSSHRYLMIFEDSVSKEEAILLVDYQPGWGFVVLDSCPYLGITRMGRSVKGILDIYPAPGYEVS